MLVLEINDMMLSLSDQDRVRLNSPGQVLFDGNGGATMHVGDQAMARRRLNPRAVHDRYWGWLDNSPLPRPAGPARSHADLACLHLRHLVQQAGERADWLLAVPGYYDDDQLALLLGIARAADSSVAGLLSAPVLAARAAGTGTDCLVLDGGWHRFTLDRVGFEQGTHYLADGDSTTVGGGWSALLDRWAQMAAGAFVAQTRLDPSHDARVEQQLYDRLPDWLRQLERDSSVVAELESGPNRYRAELAGDQFVKEASSVYAEMIRGIEQSGTDSLVLRHRLRGLPGLESALSQSFGDDLIWLDEHAPAAAALEHADLMSSDEEAAVLYVTRLPLDDAGPAPRDAAPQSATIDRERIPSHVLIGAQAVQIGAEPIGLPDGGSDCRLQRDDDGSVRLLSGDSADLRVNGAAAVEGQVLAAGDRVSVGEQEFVMLRVNGDGSA
ncbi:MAG: hypothetical protein ACNA7E_00960 [Wenzhouxiangellaceae bacterium]